MRNPATGQESTFPNQKTGKHLPAGFLDEFNGDADPLDEEDEDEDEDDHHSGRSTG